MMAARNVSMASDAACCFREGKPPTAATISFLVSFVASWMVVPWIISAIADPHASVGGHP